MVFFSKQNYKDKVDKAKCDVMSESVCLWHISILREAELLKERD